jgi:CheY-like chemotaxis protein
MFGNLFGRGKPKILVADDDEIVLSLVVELLSGQGYEVESVFDGLQAVNRLKKERFDLLIMDVHMPNMDGPQALDVIRLMPNAKDLGVIMLTSEGSMETFMHAFEKGAFAYLPKPFSPAKLIEKVQAFFEKKKQQQS